MMSAPMRGCGDDLASAKKYYNVHNKLYIVHAKQMDRDFLVMNDDNVMFLGNKGDYLTMSPYSGKRQLMRKEDWADNWKECLHQ